MNKRGQASGFLIIAWLTVELFLIFGLVGALGLYKVYTTDWSKFYVPAVVIIVLLVLTSGFRRPRQYVRLGPGEVLQRVP